MDEEDPRENVPDPYTGALVALLIITIAAIVTKVAAL